MVEGECVDENNHWSFITFFLEKKNIKLKFKQEQSEQLNPLLQKFQIPKTQKPSMFFQAFNIPRKWKFLEAQIKWKWKCLEAQVLDPCDSLPEVLWPRAGDIYLGDQTLEKKTLHVRNRKGLNTS